MNRRGFMQAILVSMTAPAFVRIGSLMAPIGLVMPHPIALPIPDMETVWLPPRVDKSDPLGHVGYAGAKIVINGICYCAVQHYPWTKKYNLYLYEDFPNKKDAISRVKQRLLDELRKKKVI